MEKIKKSLQAPSTFLRGHDVKKFNLLQVFYFGSRLI